MLRADFEVHSFASNCARPGGAVPVNNVRTAMLRHVNPGVGGRPHAPCVEGR